LTKVERDAIERLLAEVSRGLATNELEAVRRATEALIAGTDDFAASRMDRSIRAALAGRSVTELAK
jgi:molecular chaperone HscA